MKKISFKVNKELALQRLDKVIVNFCKKEGINFSRSAIKSYNITPVVNGKVEKLSYITKENDGVEFEVPEPKKLNLQPQNVDFDVIYSDNYIAVINKPAGLSVHIGAGHYENTLVNGLLYRFQGRLSSIGGVERPGIVHRLDKDTSGIMIVALDETAHQKMVEAFAKREIKKIYYAIVRGILPKEGCVTLPIARSKKNRKKMAVDPRGREAITLYKTIYSVEEVSLVEVEPKTGRTHQIRVHFSHLGHPIIGDPLYSRDWKRYKLNGLALISRRIGFYHPIEGNWMEFEVPFNENFLKLFKMFNIPML